ncbi:transcriptional regulator, AraC family [gamma proteobacterium NOR5-3]|nr:transcriptional regulator, AraC family [gamma proteobacterium NOR5-3]
MDEMEVAAQWPSVCGDAAAEHVHLSKSRFLHLFSDNIGTPWRTYLIWRRAIVAMIAIFDGYSVAHAADVAGYADAAHLSRQVKGIFGLSPTEVLAYALAARAEIPNRTTLSSSGYAGPHLATKDLHHDLAGGALMKRFDSLYGR